MGRACSTNGEKKNPYRILVGKREGKRQLGGPRRRWVDDIEMDFRERGWGGMQGSCEYDYNHSGSIKFWEILESLGDWRLLKKDSAP
jgi:hypothetical protein